MKLSQCMIVKNEEKNIRKALTWGKDICFEQIVVDTGSTDRTVEIAKEMGAKVYYFEWINDFAAAKNYAIEQATGDWIAFLDADEYMEKEVADKVPELLVRVDAYKYDRDEIGINFIGCCLSHMGDGNKVIVAQTQYRIFRNKPYIRYEGRIHEVVVDTRGYSPVEVDFTREIIIYHTGFVWSENSKELKGKRNLEILFSEYEENPNSADIEFYLADSLLLAGRNDEAYEFLHKAVKNSDGSLEPQRLLMAHHSRLFQAIQRDDVSTEEMLRMYEEAVQYNSESPDFDIALGYFYYQKDAWSEAVEYLESAINKANKVKDLTYSRLAEQWVTMCTFLTLASSKLQDWPRIVKYGTFYLQVDKKEEGVLIPILDRLINVECEPIESVLRYIKQIYDLDDRRDLYFLIKCCKERDFVMLERALKEYLTDEEITKLYG